jgi:Ser/Thr protein kinase RdoA (MazF antagonist)
LKPFEELTYRGQVERLRSVGEAALGEFGVRSPELRHIAHAENTTFQVRAARGGHGRGPGAPYAPGRYLLRIHRPGDQTPDAIASEISWLTALRNDLGLHVPDPVPARDGRGVVIVEVEGVPGPRACSLLRWMEGVTHGRKSERPSHLAMVGRIMAVMHSHAASWDRPEDFIRGRWDWDGLFESPGTAGTDESWVWDALPLKERRLYEASARNTADAMEDLGEGPEAFGLIHADLHLGNVLFGGGEARPIDFDDCADGLWLYDMAVTLYGYRSKEDWPVWRDALLNAYEEVRPLPDGVEEHLNTLMCGCCVSLMLWARARARENPRFKKRLSGWVKWANGYLTEFCEPGR